MDLERELKYDISMPTKEAFSDFYGDLNQKSECPFALGDWAFRYRSVTLYRDIQANQLMGRKKMYLAISLRSLKGGSVCQREHQKENIAMGLIPR